MRTLPLAAPSLALPALLFAQQGPSTRHAFTPADWYKVTTVSTPAQSPDGSRVAFTVTTVREAENRRHAEIWVVSTQGGEPARYTSPGFESSNPRFSDDGKILYFTSQRPGGRGATWALRMDQPGERRSSRSVSRRSAPVPRPPIEASRSPPLPHEAAVADAPAVVADEAGHPTPARIRRA